LCFITVIIIASCGLKLDDEAVRVVMGLRLGLSLYVPHQCQMQSFVCNASRHHTLNDVLSSAGVPFARDGKHPDGMSLIPWKADEPVVWEVTATFTTAAFCIDFSIGLREAGAAAEVADTCKTATLASLTFHPILDPLNKTRTSFTK